MSTAMSAVDGRRARNSDVLVSARRIYEGAGFKLDHEYPHQSFGHDLVAQVWRREL